MRYQSLLDRLDDTEMPLAVEDRLAAAKAIALLVESLREYNEDDEFFDDEKRTVVPVHQ